MQPRKHLAADLPPILMLAVVGGATFSVLPLLTAGASATLGFSERQIGVISSAIAIGSVVSALCAGFWVRSVPWRWAAACALAGMFAANVLAMGVSGFWIFTALQAAAGFFGNSAFSLALTMLSDRPEAARSFGVSNALQVVCQVLALLIGPVLLQFTGLNGILAMLAMVSGVALVLTPLLPARGRSVEQQRISTVLSKPAMLWALAGFAFFFTNVGAYWTYIELMGQAQGLTARVITNAIALGVSAGVLGGGLAWLLGDRFGRLPPLMIAGLLSVAAAVLVLGSFGVAAYTVSGLLYFFAWNYALAYQLALINAIDATGRAVAVTGAFGFLGVAAGAGLAAALVTPGDYRPVSGLVVVAVCTSTVMFTLSSLVHRRTAAQHPVSLQAG